MAKKTIYTNSRNFSDIDDPFKLPYERVSSCRYDDKRRSFYGHGYIDSHSNISRASSTESLLDDVSVRAQALFHTLDPNHRGYIRQEDVINYNPEFNEEDLMKVFAELDHDKDGAINVDDFKQGLKLLTRQLSRKKDRKKSRTSLSNYPSDQDIRNPYQMKMRKTSMGYHLDESMSALTCEEKICDFYNKAELTNPDLATMFNDVMQLIMHDVKEINKEKQLAIAQYNREKLKYEDQIHQLGEEYERQIQQVSNMEATQELQRLEKEFDQTVTKKDREISILKNRLQEMEEESSRLSSAADNSIQTMEIKEQLNRARRENSNLQVQLSNVQTEMKMSYSELVTLKQQLKEKSASMQHERESFKNLEKEYADFVKQIQILRDMNRNLQDTNDHLRSAIESSPAANEIMRKFSTSTGSNVLHAAICNDWKEEYNLIQCDPAYAVVAREKMEKYESSIIDEHGDSGLSTLRDVAELESEIEPPINAKPINLYQTHQVEDEVFVDNTVINSTDTLRSGATFYHRQPSHIDNEYEDELSTASSNRSSKRRQYCQNPRRRYNRYGTTNAINRMRHDTSNDQLSETDVIDGSSYHQTAIAAQPIVNAMPDIIFKIAFAGDASVGKSTFMMRLCTESFVTDTRATIGVDFRNKTIVVDGKSVGLQLWDTAGQERYRSMTANYFRKCDGVLLLYDSTYQESFIHVREWVDTIRSSAGDDIPIMLVANKSDLRDRYEQEGRRVVSSELGKNLAQEYEMVFVETSAKSGENIQACIDDLTRSLIKNHEVQTTSSRIDITKGGDKSTGKSQCCK